MKILKEGKLPEPDKTWWVGKKMYCNKCNAIVELEANDITKISTYVERHLGGANRVYMPCPTENCGTKLHLDKPAALLQV